MKRHRQNATRAFAACFALLALATFSGGCGGAAQGQQDTTAAPRVSGGATGDELSQYEYEIASALGEPMPQQAYAAGPYASPPSALQQPQGQYPAPTATSPVSPPPPPNDSARKADSETKPAEAAGQTSMGGNDVRASTPTQDACTIACRALASMDRSAEHICQLEPEENRCSSARARVRDAHDRVTRHCKACPS